MKIKLHCQFSPKEFTHLGHHGHDLPRAELEGVLLRAGEVSQHPGVLKLARPRLDNELAHQVPDRGRLGCADHYAASSLERDLEAVSLDGAHLANVLETEEVDNLESGVIM